MNKIIVIAIAIVVVALGIWWWTSRTAEAPSPGTRQQPNDTTQAITNDLEALDLGDLDKAFQEIDADLNSL